MSTEISHYTLSEGKFQVKIVFYCNQQSWRRVHHIQFPTDVLPCIALQVFPTNLYFPTGLSPNAIDGNHFQKHQGG